MSEFLAISPIRPYHQVMANKSFTARETEVLNSLLWHVTHNEDLLYKVTREIALSEQDSSLTNRDNIIEVLNSLHSKTVR